MEVQLARECGLIDMSGGHFHDGHIRFGDDTGDALGFGHIAHLAETITAPQGANDCFPFLYLHLAAGDDVKSLIDLTPDQDLLVGLELLPDAGMDHFPHLRFRKVGKKP